MAEKLILSLARKAAAQEPEAAPKVDEKEEMLSAAGGALVGAMQKGDGKLVGQILKDILSIAKE